MNVGCFPGEISNIRSSSAPLALTLPPASNALGCDVFSQDYTGKALLINRGTCNFCNKILNARAAYAEAVLIANTYGELPFQMSWECPYYDAVLVGIPACMVSMSDAQTLKTALSNGESVLASFGWYYVYNSDYEQEPANQVTGIGVQQLLGSYNALPAGQVPSS